MILALSIATVQADPLDKELDQYLLLTNDQPSQATALIRNLESRLTPDTPAITRARLWSYLGGDYNIQQDFVKAQHYIDLSLELAEQTQSEDIRAEALTDQLKLYIQQNEPGKGRALLAQLQDALAAAHVERIRYYAANTMASFLQTEDQYEDALEAFYQAFHAIEHSKDARTAQRKIYLQNAIAGLNTVLLRYKKADELLKAAVKQALASAELHFFLPELYLQIGLNYAAQTHNTEAEQAYQQGLTWARKLQNNYSIALLVNNLGDLRLQQSKHETAVPLFMEAQKLAEQLQHTPMIMTTEFNLGYIKVLQGQHAEGARANGCGSATSARFTAFRCRIIELYRRAS